MSDDMLKYLAEEREKRRADLQKAIDEDNKRRAEANGQIYNQSDQISKQEKMYVEADSPSTVDNTVATIWYVVIMVIGAIWLAHINRKKIRKKKWDKMQEEKKNGGNKQ